MSNHLFLVEHYDDTGSSDAQQCLPAPPPGLPLLFAVRIPADDVVLALVEGTDEATTTAVLAAAGWRVDRITSASWANPNEGDH